MINRTTRLRRLAVVCAATLALAACSSGTASSTSTDPVASSSAGSQTSAAAGAPGGTYRWSLPIAVSSMDPQTTPNVYDYAYLWPVYDRLTYLEPETGEPAPMLAQSWEVSPDATSVTLKLRDDVTFQDGEPFNAEAVKLNIERMINEPTSTLKGQVVDIASVEAVDEFTVTITMKGAQAGPMPTLLGGFMGTMVSPKAFSDPNLKTFGAGAGPYKVVSNDGNQVKYEKWDGYYNPAAQTLDAIEATNIPDDQTRLSALLSGSQDGIFLLGTMENDAKAAGMTIVGGKNPTPNGFEINMTRAEFDNVKVRQAMKYALNNQAIADASFGPSCTANTQLFADGYWANDPDLTQTYDFDPEKAKALMAEAGLSDGFSFELMSPNIPAWVTMITAIQGQLADINIKVDLNVVAGAAGNAKYWVDHQADALTSADPFLLDPSQMIQQYFGEGGLRNVAEYNNPELNALADKALATSDQAERADLYHQIQQIVSDEALSPIVICNPTTSWAFRPGVEGFQVGVNGMWDYSKVTAPAS